MFSLPQQCGSPACLATAGLVPTAGQLLSVRSLQEGSLHSAVGRVTFVAGDANQAQFRWTCYQQQSCCCCHSNRTRVWRPTRCSCLNVNNCCRCRVPACWAAITTTTVYATRAEAVEDSYFQVGASLRDFCGGQQEGKRKGRGRKNNQERDNKGTFSAHSGRHETVSWHGSRIAVCTRVSSRLDGHTSG